MTIIFFSRKVALNRLLQLAHNKKIISCEISYFEAIKKDWLHFNQSYFRINLQFEVILKALSLYLFFSPFKNF